MGTYGYERRMNLGMKVIVTSIHNPTSKDNHTITVLRSVAPGKQTLVHFKTTQGPLKVQYPDLNRQVQMKFLHVLWQCDFTHI